MPAVSVYERAVLHGLTGSMDEMCFLLRTYQAHDFSSINDHLEVDDSASALSARVRAWSSILHCVRGVLEEWRTLRGLQYERPYSFMGE